MPAESRYSPTEIELLAIMWAVRKCHMFLKGARYELIVDHKPLISIISSKALPEIDTPWITCLREKLAYMMPVAVWRQGVKHTTGDVFSRFPADQPTLEDLEGEVDIECHIKAAVGSTVRAINMLEPPDPKVKDCMLKKIRAAGQQDCEYSVLLEAIAQGFPDHKIKLDGGTRRYWKIREGLTIWEGVALYGNRVVVPHSMRREVLADLHTLHQGQERTLAWARQCIFWPDINDIKQIVRQCEKWEENKASHGREPMIQDVQPKWPGEAIAADLCYLGGREYLVVVDKYSGWPETFSRGGHN